MPVLLDESTVKDVAAVKTIPLGKSHCKLVFAPIVIGPIRASVTAAPVLPAPMVMLCAPAPLLMLRWSTIMDLPATAALTSSQPEASAEVAFIMNPKAPGCGVVIVIAIVLFPYKGGPERPPRSLWFKLLPALRWETTCHHFLAGWEHQGYSGRRSESEL